LTYGQPALEGTRSKRQVRADETRARIFDAARELFAQHGFQDTTVSAIVARAEVAKGTFFVHFPTKGAIAVELVRAQCASAERARQRVIVSAESRVAAIRATLLKLADHVAISRELSRSIFASLLAHTSIGDLTHEAFRDLRLHLEDDIRAAQGAGELDPALDSELLATSLLSLYLGAAVGFANSNEKVSFRDAFEKLLDMNLEQFQVDQGDSR
jgi:AcrR family transcriptional regulator